MSELSAEDERRVALTTRVRDTDRLPKVTAAGEVRTVNGRRVQVMHNGVLIEEGCYHGAMMTEIIHRLRGHHEPQEEAVFHELVEQLKRTQDSNPPVMVELGSFWAYYSMWFKAALPNGRNVMVEPDSANLEAGRRNFALNDMPGTFVQAGAGSSGAGHAWIRSESDGRLRRVPVVSVAELMETYDLPRIDILLCDTQGAEIAVLESCLRLMREGHVRFVVVSTHHHAITGDPLTHQRCLALIEQIDAHIIAEHTVTESCSGDGLIVASTDPRDAALAVPVTRTRARDSLFGEPEYELARTGRRRRAARNRVASHVVPLVGLATNIRRND